MAKSIQDLTNKKFGRWTVLEKTDEITSDRDRYWICQCECGTIRKVRGSSLRRGKSNSCGCIRKEKLSQKTNLIGKKFDRLVVISRSEEQSKPGNVLWHCKCDCGNECDKTTTYLHRKNFFHSCGCYSKEQISNLSKKNLINQRFGKLIVIKETDKRTNGGNIIWLCKCDCGNFINVPTHSLTSGNTSSCGCINYSIGEKNIEKLLKQFNISFKAQYSTPELKLKRFDFALLGSNKEPFRLIEFDGRQHFDDISGIWNSPESLTDIQQRDKEKNQYALSHNIPLVRIPYWERDKITLDMILGDQYLVKE